MSVQGPPGGTVAYRPTAYRAAERDGDDDGKPDEVSAFAAARAGPAARPEGDRDGVASLPDVDAAEHRARGPALQRRVDPDLRAAADRLRTLPTDSAQINGWFRRHGVFSERARSRTGGLRRARGVGGGGRRAGGAAAVARAARRDHRNSDGGPHREECRRRVPDGGGAASPRPRPVLVSCHRPLVALYRLAAGSPKYGE